MFYCQCHYRRGIESEAGIWVVGLAASLLPEEVDVISSCLALRCAGDCAVAAFDGRTADRVEYGLRMHAVNEDVVVEEAAFD